MAIRLYNRTKHPDAVLRRALVYTARRMGVKSEIVVKVTTGRYGWVRGRMYQGWPYAGFLCGWRHERGSVYRRSVGSHSGWYTITIPPPRAWSNSLSLSYARDFVEVALHETAHVADHRAGLLEALRMKEDYTSSGRRPAHKRRPVEVSAENRVYDARPRSAAEHRRYDAVVEVVVASLRKTHQVKEED